MPEPNTPPEFPPVLDTGSRSDMEKTSKAPHLSPVLLVFAIFPIAALVVALMLVFVRGDAETPHEVTPPPVDFVVQRFVGNPAPDFTLKTATGGTVTLSQFHGKVVFLNFWATWCAPCKQEMPVFQELIDGRIPANATVLAVDADPLESADDVNTFETSLKVKIPSALDIDGTVSALYQVIAKPRTFVIDQSGIIRYDQLGAMNEDMLRQYLDVLGASYF